MKQNHAVTFLVAVVLLVVIEMGRAKKEFVVNSKACETTTNSTEPACVNATVPACENATQPSVPALPADKSPCNDNNYTQLIDAEQCNMKSEKPIDYNSTGSILFSCVHNGNFADMIDKSAYWYCDVDSDGGFIAVRRRCPDDHFFSPQFQDCVYKHDIMRCDRKSNCVSQCKPTFMNTNEAANSGNSTYEFGFGGGNEVGNNTKKVAAPSDLDSMHRSISEVMTVPNEDKLVPVMYEDTSHAPKGNRPPSVNCKNGMCEKTTSIDYSTNRIPTKEDLRVYDNIKESFESKSYEDNYDPKIYGNIEEHFEATEGDVNADVIKVDALKERRDRKPFSFEDMIKPIRHKTQLDMDQYSSPRKLPDRIEEHLDYRQPKANVVEYHAHLPSRTFSCLAEGIFADPRSCSSFYLCHTRRDSRTNHIEPLKILCPSDTAYDPTVEKCTRRAYALCFETKPADEGLHSNIYRIKKSPVPRNRHSFGMDFVCTGEGRFADPFDCKNYHLCYKGGSARLGTKQFGSLEFVCPEGTLFDASNGRCASSSAVEC